MKEWKALQDTSGSQARDDDRLLAMDERTASKEPGECK